MKIQKQGHSAIPSSGIDEVRPLNVERLAVSIAFLVVLAVRAALW